MECFDAKLSQLPQWYLNSRIAERWDILKDTTAFSGVETVVMLLLRVSDSSQIQFKSLI